jgi:hypothetical protein
VVTTPRLQAICLRRPLWRERRRTMSACRSEGIVMRRLLLAATIVLSCSSAFALPTSVKKGLKLGSGCVGAVSTVAPKLAMCAIAGPKSRIWCPNGDIFDLDDEKSPVPLVRSLCNLTQIP